MSTQEDPFYNRKQIPDSFIQNVGYTGLTSTEENDNRERKFSLGGMGDLRKFSNPKDKHGKLDPHYARKPVPDALIKDVGYTGLTQEQEYENRERKYSLQGADLRKFSHSTKGFVHPTDDPYYGRKPVDKTQIVGVGDSGLTAAEEYEVRDRKASMFDLSPDPFAQVTGRGHRASVAGAEVEAHAAAAARRRSSAVAPDAQHAPAHHHSGYDGAQLQPIISKTEKETDQITPSPSIRNANGHDGIGTNGAVAPAGQTSAGTYHDATTTHGHDGIAPHEHA